jgi:GGDEF domain-containing protein
MNKRRKQNKKRTIFRLFLIPVIVLIVVQSLLTTGILFFASGSYRDNAANPDTNGISHGLYEEQELLGIGQEFYPWIVLAILIGLVFGALSVFVVVHRLTGSLRWLLSCISKGREGLDDYQVCDIQEIDDLYDAVQGFAREQQEAQDVLLAEKESCRTTLENMRDRAEELKNMTTDGVTGFYSYITGMETLEKCLEKDQTGALLYIRMENLEKINEQNGIVFGDMILEEFGQIVRDHAGECLAQRFNADSFCIWMQGADRVAAKELLEIIYKQFHQRFDPKIFGVDLRIGVFCVSYKERIREIINKANQAQIAASNRKDGVFYCFYEDIQDEKVNHNTVSTWKGEQLITTEYRTNVNLASLALAIFVKGLNLDAQIKLVLQKLGRYYGASDVQLRVIRPENHSIELEYEWHRDLSREPVECVKSYLDLEWGDFCELMKDEVFLYWDENEILPPIAEDFCRPEVSANGFAMPLYDHGSIMGILSILNISKPQPEEEEIKTFRDVSKIIQSQMKHQKHKPSDHVKDCAAKPEQTERVQ